MPETPAPPFPEDGRSPSTLGVVLSVMEHGFDDIGRRIDGVGTELGTLRQEFGELRGIVNAHRDEPHATPNGNGSFVGKIVGKWKVAAVVAGVFGAGAGGGWTFHACGKSFSIERTVAASPSTASHGRNEARPE